MPALNQDVTVWQSDSFAIAVPVKTEAGANVDLTGATAEWWVSDALASGQPRTDGTRHIRKFSGSGLSITSASGLFTVRITLAPADTASMKPGTYYHELEVVDVAGNHSTVAVGKFIVRQTIIRP